MNLRRILELTVRGTSLKRRMPPPFDGAFLLVSGDARLELLKPGPEGFDKMLLARAEELVKPGMSVWDIGANVGLFSVAAAARGATVLAVEADPWLAELLQRTANLPENANLKLSVAPFAVSDKDGVAKFFIANRGRASNALAEAGGHSQMGGVREERLTPTLRIDTLSKQLPPPDLLKIDIEGAEAMAIRGANALLRDRRPTIIIEVGGKNADEITGALHELGYHLYDAALPASERSLLTRCVENTLAIPSNIALT
jgi:FkbM family methyltransferase